MKSMKSISLNGPINLIGFMYILSLYLFNGITGKTIYSNILALVLMVFIWMKFIITKRNLVINKLLIFQGIFIVICTFSYFIAIEPELVLSKNITLGLIFLLMLSLVNYVDSYEKLRKFIMAFIYSGLIVSMDILINSNFSELTRFGEEYGNVNAVGTGIAISAILCFYIILHEKKYHYSLFFAIMTITIFLTGSRKSIMFVVITMISTLYLKARVSYKDKIKFLVISIVAIGALYYLLFKVPIFYEIIGKRMSSMLSFVSGEGTIEGSINERALMIKYGFDMFKEKPLIGYGIDNYRILFGRAFGNWTYAHNNYIELMVGTGILGLFAYYLTHIIVLKDLFYGVNKSKYKTLYYVFISIIISYVLLSVSLIYYYSKHFSILIALASCIIRFDKYDNYHGLKKKVEE